MGFQKRSPTGWDGEAKFAASGSVLRARQLRRRVSVPLLFPAFIGIDPPPEFQKSPVKPRLGSNPGASSERLGASRLLLIHRAVLLCGSYFHPAAGWCPVKPEASNSV